MNLSKRYSLYRTRFRRIFSRSTKIFVNKAHPLNSFYKYISFDKISRFSLKKRTYIYIHLWIHLQFRELIFIKRMNDEHFSCNKFKSNINFTLLLFPFARAISHRLSKIRRFDTRYFKQFPLEDDRILRSSNFTRLLLTRKYEFSRSQCRNVIDRVLWNVLYRYIAKNESYRVVD